VGLVYDSRGLPGVMTARPEVAGVLQRRATASGSQCPQQPTLPRLPLRIPSRCRWWRCQEGRASFLLTTARRPGGETKCGAHRDIFYATMTPDHLPWGRCRPAHLAKARNHGSREHRLRPDT
jgi:hypothetical protein